MNFRAFGPPVLVVSKPVLGVNPPAVIDTTDGQVPKTIGEPSLNAALAMLTSAEAADYNSWDSQSKLMFLAAYQYVATAIAAGLRRPDGTPFDGFLTSGVTAALGAMDILQPYVKQMDSNQATATDQAASVLQNASTKTEPQGLTFAKRFLLLRDRIAWELATQYDLTVEYEVLGTDPANPGLLYTRKVGEDKPADFSAVFSSRSPSQLWADGLSLEDKFDALGVTFKRLDMSGANRRMGAGPAAILAVLITLVVGILTFYWLWNHVNQGNKLTDLAASLVAADTTLTAAQKADRLAKLKAADSLFAQVFGDADIPWTGILIALGVGVLAALAYPIIADALKGHHRLYHSHRPEHPRPYRPPLHRPGYSAGAYYS